MEEKKHIDRLFQEKLKDFEVFPEPDVWKNIEQELSKKKRRRIVPLWLRLGSAAAILFLLVSTGFWYFDQDDQLPNPINTKSPLINDDIDQQPSGLEEESKETLDAENQRNNQNEQGTEIKPNQNGNTDEGTIAKQIPKTYNITKQAKESENTASKGNAQEIAIAQNSKTTETTRKEDSKETDQKALEQRNTTGLLNEKKSTVADNKTPERKEFQITKDDIAEAIEDQLSEENTSDARSKKWSVGTAIAPVYFNSLSDGSPINTSLSGNEKETNTSLSYGVKVNYQINDRLSLQSGINNVELAYKTQGVTALIASSEMQFSGADVGTNINGINLIAISNNQIAAQSSELGAQRGVINLRGDLNQSMSYIEIPMEAKYALLNKKFGVHLVGGVSTYLLYSNEVSLLDQNGSTSLGEASNINDVNFSGNLGLDLDYKLNKKLFINVSPMFKYQMNTFSRNDGGFQPYYLGVYTGLNFRF